MTFKEFSENLELSLADQYEKAECKAISALLLDHFCGIERGCQRGVAQNTIPENILGQFHTTLEKLKSGMPVQYALSCTWFLNRKFFVNRGVLIPRPETEELILWVQKTLLENGMENPDIIDIGTGSGCIAISLSLMLEKANVTAIDISKEAVEVATRNAKQLMANVRCQKIDFLDDKQTLPLPTFDVMVSNPPYIPLGEKKMMENHITEWEPDIALFTPNNDPQIFYKRMIPFAKRHLNSQGLIFLEGHQDYLADTEKIFNAEGFETEIKKDLHGNLRMLRAKKNS